MIIVSMMRAFRNVYAETLELRRMLAKRFPSARNQ